MHDKIRKGDVLRPTIGKHSLHDGTTDNRQQLICLRLKMVWLYPEFIFAIPGAPLMQAWGLTRADRITYGTAKYATKPKG
ncbi:hypothetical protein TNCV_374591 [Trichonephila clavipes]|nr:hypothetical protein TNCV_374591 [Trichonephila clavipes]